VFAQPPTYKLVDRDRKLVEPALAHLGESDSDAVFCHTKTLLNLESALELPAAYIGHLGYPDAGYGTRQMRRSVRLDCPR
jgi:hypothetical protein